MEIELACVAGGFRVGLVGFGVIEKAGKAKKRAELSGRRGEARGKTTCRW